MTAPILESERLLYEPLSLIHLSQRYVDWLNNPVVCKYIAGAGNYTLPKLRKFLYDIEKRNILFWAIHQKATHEHIGNIKIDPIIEKHGLGEYGILLGEKLVWGMGYAHEASQTILDYCFNELNLRKITLGVVEKNTVAVRLYQKLGFVIEGRYKEHELHDGEYCDTLRMALFKNSFSLK